MRLTSFMGEIPKVAPTSLPHTAAVVAENCDLYSGELRAIVSPRRGPEMADVYGRTVSFSPETLYRSDGSTIAFPSHTSVAPDPQNRSGPDGFLFVEDGVLYRASGRSVRMGEPPIPVGISPPKEAPTGVVLEGEGCDAVFPELLCVPTSDPDCAPDAVPPEAVAYVYTYLSGCGEESAPSPVSDIIDRMPNDATLLNAPGTPPSNAVAIRWYRSVAGSDGNAVFLFAGQTEIGQMFIDNLCPFDLGEALSTERHLPPPTCLDGVAVLGDGITVVWSGRRLWLSEPFLPHAFPPEWELELPYNIVTAKGVTEFVEGATTYWLGVLTEGKPYTVTGKLPEQAKVSELQVWLPPVSPRAVVEAEGVIFYASAYGMHAFSGSGVQTLTDDSHTEREWVREYPESMALGYWRGVLYAFATSPTPKGLSLPVSRTIKTRPNMLTRITLPVVAVYSSPKDGMWVALQDGVVADPHSYEWGVGPDLIGYRWKSKPVVQSGRWHPTSMKVVADFPRLSGAAQRAKQAYLHWSKQFRRYGDVQGFIESFPELAVYAPTLVGPQAEVEVRVIADREVIYTRVVGHDQPFRLPRVRKGIEWQVEILGKIPVREIHIQTSHDDLTAEGGHA